MTGALLALDGCFVGGGLLLASTYLAQRRPSLAVRLRQTRGEPQAIRGARPDRQTPDWLIRVEQHYRRALRTAGSEKTLRRLAREKLLLFLATPLVLLLPYAAATGRLLSLPIALCLAVSGSFVPDLVLLTEGKTRREAIFLDLPEAIAILALSLRAGQSLRQALELAARDCHGPLATELEHALTLARRERGTDERQALVTVARDAGEPNFIRFTELLAAKESPYLEFLRQQAREARAEQNRYLERAADRAYLSMHAPLAPLLAVLVLVLAYGFLHFLAQTT